MQQDVELYTDEVPLACTLTESEQVTRKPKVNDLFKHVQQVNELADGYALRFPGSDTWANELMQFITFERGCCPFFTFALVFEQKLGANPSHLGTNPPHQRRYASTATQSGEVQGERRCASEPSQLASAPIHRSSAPTRATNEAAPLPLCGQVAREENEAAPLPLRGQERCKENDADASTAAQSGKLQGVLSQSGGTSGEGSIWLHLRGPEGVKAIIEGMMHIQTR